MTSDTFLNRQGRQGSKNLSRLGACTSPSKSKLNSAKGILADDNSKMSSPVADSLCTIKGPSYKSFRSTVPEEKQI